MSNEFDEAYLEGSVTSVILALLAPLDDDAVGRVIDHASQWHEGRQDRAEVLRAEARRAVA